MVPLTHGNISIGVQHVKHALARTAGDVCLNMMPLFHIHGLLVNGLVSLASARRARAIPASTTRPAGVTRLKESTWYSAVPTIHLLILDGCAQAGKPLPTAPATNAPILARNCSAALVPAVAKQLEDVCGFSVLATYAMSESYPICANPLTGSTRKHAAGSGGRAVCGTGRAPV